MEMNPCIGQIFNVRIEGDYLISFGFYYSTSSVSSAADYQHSQAWAVPAWAVWPCGLVLQGQKDSSRRYATYAVDQQILG